MATLTVYPLISIEVEVPDDYKGIIENDMELCADFTATKFNIEGCALGEVRLSGWLDEDDLETQ